MKKIVIACFILFFMLQKLTAQSGSAKFCVDAEPLCGSTLFSYPNTSGINFGEDSPDYGCLTVPVNPAWFFFQIAKDGYLQLKISQATTLNGSSDLDVDFVAYGPFSNPSQPCDGDLVEKNIIDCSFRTDYVEYLDIVNAKAGEYYILLITNFSTEQGYISVEQTLGEASTNCNLLSNPEFKTIESCYDSAFLDATTEGGNLYVWYEETLSASNEFSIIENLNSDTIEIMESKAYLVKVYNSSNVFLKEIVYDVNIYSLPEENQNISDFIICLEDDAVSATFQLNTKNEEILNGLDSSTFSVSYYENESKAQSGTSPLSNIYTSSTLVETIYARIENTESGELNCYSVLSFLLIAEKKPQVELDDSYIICLNKNGTETIESPTLIDTELNVIDYIFNWYVDDRLLPSEDDSFLIPKTEGTYTVNIISKLTNCNSFFETEVIASVPPEAKVELVSKPFIENNTLEIITKNQRTEEYQYRLDNGAWQENNVFYNVSIGEHAIAILDPLGCGETQIKVMVMDYPLFFTPNGDGYNDSWNIVGVPNEWEAKVSIFDRYGKLIKQIVPNNSGWDGTFNGNQLPSDDYWFYMEYYEPDKNSNQTFKSHFTLKR